VRTYLVGCRLAKYALGLIDDPENTLIIKDESITISSRDSSLSIEWDRIIKFRVVDGFLIFLYKQIPEFISREILSNEQLEFIRSKMSKR